MTTGWKAHTSGWEAALPRALQHSDAVWQGLEGGVHFPAPPFFLPFLPFRFFSFSFSFLASAPSVHPAATPAGQEGPGCGAGSDAW
ncbi:MAG: hypothetical protein KC442_17230 [Thermomicrobiales bacterium]|nr:hypothetical protein [Thermomicrobiales bacterium]